MSETLKVTADVAVPRPVRYLRLVGWEARDPREGSPRIPITAIEDEGLREIGRLYGDALVAEAAKMRAQQQKENDR